MNGKNDTMFFIGVFLQYIHDCNLIVNVQIGNGFIC